MPSHATACACPGAGAFEVAAAHHLRTVTRKTVEGRAKLGIDAFADALLGVAKVHTPSINTHKHTHTLTLTLTLTLSVSTDTDTDAELKHRQTRTRT